ncbi:MAG: hypothetical protein AVDCRST_MAG59-1158, partial [uncultured Thermomicrobiales bacterium]
VEEAGQAPGGRRQEPKPGPAAARPSRGPRGGRLAVRRPLAGGAGRDRRRGRGGSRAAVRRGLRRRPAGPAGLRAAVAARPPVVLRPHGGVGRPPPAPRLPRRPAAPRRAAPGARPPARPLGVRLDAVVPRPRPVPRAARPGRPRLLPPARRPPAHRRGPKAPLGPGTDACPHPGRPELGLPGSDLAHRRRALRAARRRHRGGGRRPGGPPGGDAPQPAGRGGPARPPALRAAPAGRRGQDGAGRPGRPPPGLPGPGGDGGRSGGGLRRARAQPQPGRAQGVPPCRPQPAAPRGLRARPRRLRRRLPGRRRPGAARGGRRGLVAVVRRPRGRGSGAPLPGQPGLAAPLRPARGRTLVPPGLRPPAELLPRARGVARRGHPRLARAVPRPPGALPGGRGRAPLRDGFPVGAGLPRQPVEPAGRPGDRLRERPARRARVPPGRRRGQGRVGRRPDPPGQPRRPRKGGPPAAGGAGGASPAVRRVPARAPGAPPLRDQARRGERGRRPAGAGDRLPRRDARPARAGLLPLAGPARGGVRGARGRARAHPLPRRPGERPRGPRRPVPTAPLPGPPRRVRAERRLRGVGAGPARVLPRHRLRRRHGQVRRHAPVVGGRGSAPGAVPDAADDGSQPSPATAAADEVVARRPRPRRRTSPGPVDRAGPGAPRRPAPRAGAVRAALRDDAPHRRAVLEEPGARGRGPHGVGARGAPARRRGPRRPGAGSVGARGGARGRRRPGAGGDRGRARGRPGGGRRPPGLPLPGHRLHRAGGNTRARRHRADAASPHV